MPRGPHSTVRSTGFVFTEYEETNYDQIIETIGDGIEGFGHGFRYVVGQLEICPDTGRIHLQGYIELTRQQRLSWLKKNFSDTAHYEPRYGTPEEAREYAMKDDTRYEGPWECGKYGGNQGKRSDLEDIKDKLDKGVGLTVIADEHWGSWVRYHKAFESYLTMKLGPREVSPKNIVIIGPSGCGKSELAKLLAPDAYYKPPQTKWFSGYTGQKVIIFNNHNTAWLPFDTLMNIMQDPVQVEPKGGFIHCQALVNIFTSTTEPTSWYKPENIQGSLSELLYFRL